MHREYLGQADDVKEENVSLVNDLYFILSEAIVFK